MSYLDALFRASNFPPEFYKCPLCQQEIVSEIHEGWSRLQCPTYVTNTKQPHYYILYGFQERFVQHTIIPPFMIITVLEESKSQIYKIQYGTTVTKDLIMQIPAISYQQLQNPDHLIQRLKTLIVFS